MSKASYLVIDPGDTCGFARFDAAGELLEFGQFIRTDTSTWVKNCIKADDLKRIIVEDYKNWAHGNFRQKAGGRNETSKVIATIETIGEYESIPVTLQAAAKYPVGAAWGGIKIPSNHSISHQYVAIAHGIYWLQTNKIIPPGKALMNRGNE